MKTLAIVATTGARTALGRSAMQTGLLLRTGMPAMAASPLADEKGEQVTMCFDPTLDPMLVGDARAAALAIPALEEALAPLGEGIRALRMELVLCLDGTSGPAAARGEPVRGAALAARVHARARELAPGIALEICARGAAGAAFVLPQALDALVARRVDAILLGGIHSDYDPATIAALEAQGRLFSPTNLDALVPGEAAAFVLLTREDVARRIAPRAGGGEPRLAARIAAVGTGMERATPDNDVTPFEAIGLTSAIRSAAAELEQRGMKSGWAITDHTFETRRMHEWQAMMTRTHALWGEPGVIDSPAQRIGHLGAAALPLAMALASEAWRRGYAPAPVAMALAGSDAGERGAVLLFSEAVGS